MATTASAWWRGEWLAAAGVEGEGVGAFASAARLGATSHAATDPPPAHAAAARSAIPLRFKPGVGGPEGVEVLLISSRSGKGHVFPKGGWEKDEGLRDAAMRETVEEAGVRGELEVRARCTCCCWPLAAGCAICGAVGHSAGGLPPAQVPLARRGAPIAPLARPPPLPPPSPPLCARSPPWAPSPSTPARRTGCTRRTRAAASRTCLPCT